MTTTISQTYTRREWQTVALLGLVALLIVSYIYLVNRVVFHAVGKQTASREIAALAGEVVNLESQTLTLGNRVTMELAYERGFSDCWSSCQPAWLWPRIVTRVFVISRQFS